MFPSSLFFVASALRAGASSDCDEAVLDVTAVYFFFSFFFFWERLSYSTTNKEETMNPTAFLFFYSSLLLFFVFSTFSMWFLSQPGYSFSSSSLFKSERAARSRLINWYWPCWTRGRLAGSDIYTARRCTQDGARDIFAFSEGIFGGICGIMDHEESSTGSILCLGPCGRKPFPGKINQVIRIPRADRVSLFVFSGARWFKTAFDDWSGELVEN
jgi:hypothetical protein